MMKNKKNSLNTSYAAIYKNNKANAATSTLQMARKASDSSNVSYSLPVSSNNNVKSNNNNKDT